MNYNKKTVRDFDPHGKKVLLRCDFNVPSPFRFQKLICKCSIIHVIPLSFYVFDKKSCIRQFYF